jgi:hypothetical protein
LIVLYNHLHLSAGAMSEIMREKIKRLNSLLNDFTTLFLGFYASLILYSEIGREEGKITDDSPYTYIYTPALLWLSVLRIRLQDCAIVGYRDRSSSTDARGPYRVGHLSGLLASRQSSRVRVSDNTVRSGTSRRERRYGRLRAILALSSVSFSPDGKLIVSGSSDKTV